MRLSKPPRGHSPPGRSPLGQWGGRLERRVVLAVVVGAHAVVLVLLARPVTVDFPDRSNDDNAVDVTLHRVWRPAHSTSRSEAASPALHQPARAAPATMETLPLTPAPAGPATAYAQTVPGPRGDLGAALRTGGFACAGGRNALLSPEERARCQEKLGALALRAPPLPAPIDPDKRVYYDAVAEAYRDPGQMVPLTARGAGGIFGAERSVHSGHGPRVGCSVKFGPNARKAPKGPPNALRAGPCFIQPPTGSLTPEVDVPRPY